MGLVHGVPCRNTAHLISVLVWADLNRLSPAGKKPSGGVWVDDYLIGFRILLLVLSSSLYSQRNVCTSIVLVR